MNLKGSNKRKTKKKTGRQGKWEMKKVFAGAGWQVLKNGDWYLLFELKNQGSVNVSAWK